MHEDEHPFYPSRDPGEGLKEDQGKFLESAIVTLDRPSLFYASLRHPRLFETVVGRSMEAGEWERVEVPGFRLGIVDAGTGFPGIFPADDGPEEPLECIVVHDLSAFEQTMVAWYEFDEYVLRPIPLEDGRSVQAFVPDLDAIRAEHGSCSIEPWSFEAWWERHLERAVKNAREWMSQRPDDASLVEARFFAPDEAPASRRAAGRGTRRYPIRGSGSV